jgi:hypothetical protein
MQDPINAELVQQLEEYLSDTAKVELKHAIDEEQQEAQATQPADDSNSVAPSSSSEGHSAPPSHGGGSHPSFTGNIMDDFGEDELADVEIPDDMGGDAPAEEPATEEPEPVESVTQEGRPITSSTAIIWTTLDDVVSDATVIKGTLNAREDTSGVSRIEVKDSELWIYYNDDSNLNDKMVEVISVLNSPGYTYLKFNRLARSNNAIVFDVNLNVEPIKSVKEVEEDKK